MRPSALIALANIVLVGVTGGVDANFLGQLNVDELEKLHYAIEIDGKPVKIGGTADSTAESGAAGHVIPIVNKFGQRYHCTLPQLELDDDDQDADESAEYSDASSSSLESLEYDSASAESSEAPLNTKERIQQLLSPLKKSACLFRTKDWWTYELCVGRSIKQYHAEDGKPKGVIQILGHYDSDYDWQSENGGGIPEEEIVGARKYHSQFYTNGTKCDLTGHFRRAEVRFVCDPSAVFDSLIEVEEPLSCEYLLTVATKKICAIDQLRPEPSKKPKEIKCSPALTEEEFEKYLQFEKAQEELYELKKKEQKREQKERMLKVLAGENLDGIDVDTDEGFARMEGMMQEKLAEKLVSELETLLSPKAIMDQAGDMGGLTFRRVLAEDLLLMGNGQCKNPTFFDVINGLLRDWETRKLRKDMLNLLGMDKTYRKEGLPSEEDDVIDVLDPNEKRQIKDEAGFDLEAERKVRSDLVSEEDMMEELSDTVSKMPTGKREETKAFVQSEQFKKELDKAMNEIVEETERETGTKLDRIDDEGRDVLNEFSDAIKDLMAKVDMAEEKIQKVNKELEHVRRMAAEDEDYDGEFGKSSTEDEVRAMPSPRGESLEESGSGEQKPSLAGDSAEDIDLFRGDTQKGDDVKVKVTDLTHVTALKESSTEAKVTKNLEAVIKQKLAKAGLDTGGRQIEVKLVTTSSLGSLGESEETESRGLAALTGGSVDGEEKEVSDDEQHQFRNMIYNLMIGNTAAYEDIDEQRRSERNYKFAWDDALLEKTSTASAKARSALEAKPVTGGPTPETSASSDFEGTETKSGGQSGNRLN